PARAARYTLSLHDALPICARLSIRRLDGDGAADVAAHAALQPLWLSDDELVLADDASGRWNLVRVRLDGLRVRAIDPVAPADAEDRKSTRLNSSHVKISYA